MQVAALTRSQVAARAGSAGQPSSVAAAPVAPEDDAVEEKSGGSSVIAPALLDDIRRAAATDDAYYVPLLAKAEHLGWWCAMGLVYSASGLLYIPKDEEVRAILLREVHDTPTGGHLGREKT